MLTSLDLEDFNVVEHALSVREMGLKSKVSKKFSSTTTVSDPAQMAAPNVLNQSFKADAPNRK